MKKCASGIACWAATRACVAVVCGCEGCGESSLTRECDSRASRWGLFTDQWRSDDEESPSEGESESDEGVHAVEEVCANAKSRSAPEARAERAAMRDLHPDKMDWARELEAALGSGSS